MRAPYVLYGVKYIDLVSLGKKGALCKILVGSVYSLRPVNLKFLHNAPFFQNGLQAKSGFDMCFGPSTLGAGAKTRLESRIKEITPHCVCRLPTSPPLLAGGFESDCINRTTCFASMSAGLPGGGSNQHTNYANFRIFAETLLAGVLDAEYELGIMTFREAHRGTLLGMTRFRDLLDDMPILGYGRSSLRHDRLQAFHSTLAGHSLNYLSRGTYWGAEQRKQNQGSFGHVVDNRYRNDCGIGGEDCSLCMVSAVASAYWVRWMLADAHLDDSVVYVARGAPRRWYQPGSAWGIAHAPTRFGRVTFTMAVHDHDHVHDAKKGRGANKEHDADGARSRGAGIGVPPTTFAIITRWFFIKIA